MDFELIERHPWITTSVVLGGGFLLYLVLHRNSTSAAASTGTVTYSGVDPQTAALDAQLQAQQSQQQAYIAGLQLQGGTQVSLAQIGADVSKYTVGAQADVTNQQTAAQLALGLGTQNAVVQQTQINADVQMKAIDAIIAAFTGNNPGGNPSVSPGPVTVQTPNSPNPTAQLPPPIPVNVSAPVYNPNSPPVGNVNPGSSPPNYTIIPGGTQLVPTPNYIPVGAWPNTADVMANQATQIQWENNTLAANAANNRAQCLANANLSKGFANYDSLVAACG